MGRETKIAPTIVIWFAIDVVNDIRRPLASHPKYSERASSKKILINRDLPITKCCERSGSCSFSHEATASVDAPSEDTRRRIVVEQFPQSNVGERHANSSAR